MWSIFVHNYHWYKFPTTYHTTTKFRIAAMFVTFTIKAALNVEFVVILPFRIKF
jgi:hypothetical protein